MALSDQVKEIIDTPVFAHVATVGPAGHPQNTVMWIDRDGDQLVLNTAAGRAKWHNLEHDPRVGISISPVDDPYVNLSIKGRVVEMRTSDGDEVIDRLANKYLGVDDYPYRRPDETRVTVSSKWSRWRATSRSRLPALVSAMPGPHSGHSRQRPREGLMLAHCPFSRRSPAGRGVDGGAAKRRRQRRPHLPR